MREREITLPELGMVAGTRVMLGAGLGLLLGAKLNNGQRQGAGWALLAVGALTTIPLALEILGRGSAHSANEPGKAVGNERTTGATPRFQR